MAQTQTSCPRCRQPVIADVTQLFDMHQDSTAKQKLLSGAFNLIQCPHCGYNGSLNTPIVYHDPDKELLLTYFPPELGVPANEQEKLIGPLIKQTTDRLPPEKRKSYLLTPKTMLTMQGLIETILESDGITREMIEEQQNQIKLLQQLMNTPEEQRKELITKEESNINETFFMLLNRLIDASLANGDENSAKQLAELQHTLFETTETGMHIQAQAVETEQVVKLLQEAGKDGLTREKLLDLVMKSESDTQLTTYVSLARSGMDYQFFQLLSLKIDSSDQTEKERLTSLREKLLEMTREMDEEINKRVKTAGQMLDEIINSPDIEKSTNQKLREITSIFVEVLGNRIEEAQQKGETDKLEKLQIVAGVIQQATTPPAELLFIQELMDAKDDSIVKELLENNEQKVTPEFISMLNNVIAQAQSSEEADQDSRERLNVIYRSALSISMRKNLQQ
ncbi:MAG: CpXC domain-containing protein [Anaerolineaceae bacterium]|nr:CpXC domain-containing protein [Anaerolineaceae bacterium]